MTNSDVPHLPDISADPSRWLLGEAQRVLRRLGHESTVIEDGALELRDGRTLGLENLARTLPRIPRRHWARAVRDQLSTVVRADPTQPVRGEELRAKLLPFGQPQDLEYEPLELLPGIPAILAAQGDGMSLLFGKLDTVGDRDEAYDKALTNMTTLPLPQHTRRLVDPHRANSWVEFLDAGDPYGASRVMVLPDLIRRMFDTEIPATGLVVAVPNKFELWVHFPVDESVMDTAVVMAWLAYKGWAEEPYPISPNVFLVSPDMSARVLVAPDNEGFDLHPRPMIELLESLDGPEGERRAG